MRKEEPKYVPVPPDVTPEETQVIGIVTGATRKLVQKGEEVPTVSVARVVLTTDGTMEVIAGGPDQSITVFDAAKIANEETKRKIKNTRRRMAAEKKRKQEALKKKIQKGSTGS